MNSTIKVTDSSGQEWEVLPEEHYFLADISFKIIMIGNSNVGKSCLAERAAKNIFIEKRNSTIGFEFLSYALKHKDKIIQLQIWDTCGQEIYRSLITNFYRNASLAIIVYSIDNRESFKKVGNWLKELKLYSGLDTQIFLVGNKADLEAGRVVSTAEVEAITRKHQYSLFLETSAKTGVNVHSIFIEAAKRLYDNYLRNKTVLNKKKQIKMNESSELYDDSQSQSTRGSILPPSKCNC